MPGSPNITLNDGKTMPQLGLGVWQVPDAEATPAVRAALAAGYRSIDTAAIYKNEAGVGEAIAASGVPRNELFVTTKVWNSDQGFDETLRAFDRSLELLRLDYVDLYLIHWPAPAAGKYVDTWKALVRLHAEGRARSIGVSNFHAPHLQRIVDETGVRPVLNQIELHPYFQQRGLRAFHQKLGIATESWSPLAQGTLFEDPVLHEIAVKHDKSIAQVVLRWHLDQGLVTIPKSVTPARIRENFAVFDFRLDEEDLRRIAALDAGRRLGPNPDNFG